MPAPAFLDLGEWRLQMRTRTVKSARSPLSPTLMTKPLPVASTHRGNYWSSPSQAPGAHRVAQLPFAAHWRSSGKVRTLGSLAMEFEWRGRGGPAVGRPGSGAESQFWIEISRSGSLAVSRGRASRIASERGRGWRPDEGSKGMRERETLALSIYTSTYWVHVSALLTGFAGADSIFSNPLADIRWV
jgi:hypothetical protein